MTIELVKARRNRQYRRKTRRRPSAVAAGVSGRRWFVLVRQSKKRFDDAGHATTTSIEVQEEGCRRTIAGLDPAPEAIEVYIDHGVSGGHGITRPARDRLMELVAAGDVDAVMAFKADRIGRDIEESEHLWNHCVEAGVFVCATDCLDLSDPMYRAVYFGKAQKDLEDRGDYALAVLDRRRRAGKPPCKTGAPFGLRWQDDELVVHAREFPTVKEIISRFDSGESMGRIALALTARKARRRKGSRVWNSAAVSRILHSSWYVGLVPDGRYPDGSDRFWDAGVTFVDRALWERVQARLARNADNNQHSDHPLTGLLYCGACEGWTALTLCYSRKKRKDGSVLVRHRYRCPHHVWQPDVCPGMSIDSERTELLLLPNVAALLSSNDLFAERFARRTRAVAEQADERASRLAARIDALTREQQRLLDKWLAGGVPEDLYDERMPRLTDGIRQLQQQRQELLRGTTLSAAATRRVRRELVNDGPLTVERWEAIPPGRRNDFLRLMFPHGLFVLPAHPDEPRGSVKARLALRRASDAEDAEQRRLAILYAPTA